MRNFAHTAVQHGPILFLSYFFSWHITFIVKQYVNMSFSCLSTHLSSHLSLWLSLLSLSQDSARVGSPRISPRASHWRASAGPIRWWPWATHRWRAALPRRSPTRRSRCHRTKSAAPRPRTERRPRHRLRPDPATETWHHLLWHAACMLQVCCGFACCMAVTCCIMLYMAETFWDCLEFFKCFI